MSAKTGIEWTDATWSPIRVRVRQDAAAIARAKGYTSLIQIAEKMAGRVGPHCERVSPGCEKCYSGRDNHRCLPANGTGLPFDRRSRDLVETFLDDRILEQPLAWRRPRKIFVENQSDLFGEWVSREMIDRVFAVMGLCPQHTFQVLTKRADQMRCYLRVTPTVRESDRGTVKLPLKNVWLGVSVENQATADERIPLLLQTPAAKRFVSYEPALGPVDFTNVGGRAQHDALTGEYQNGDIRKTFTPRLDWVICGGESGPGARPMHPDWARSVRDQCATAGVPFFFKQWGEYAPGRELKEGDEAAPPSMAVYPDGLHEIPDCCSQTYEHIGANLFEMKKVGKKTAGALLDGREWKEFPRGASDPTEELR